MMLMMMIIISQLLNLIGI